MKIILIAKIILVAAAITSLAYAQATRRQATPPTPNKRTESATKNHAQSAPKLGNDVAQLIAALKTAALKGKGEYETSEAYAARERALIEHFGQLTFVLPASLSEFTYDADTQLFNLYLATDMDFFNCDANKGLEACSDSNFASTSHYTINVNSKLIAEGSYLGSNAYGAKATVRTRTFSLQGISINNLKEWTDHFKEEEAPIGIKASFSVAVDLARAVKPHLRVAVAGKLAKPLIYRSTFSPDRPTLEIPYEIKKKGDYIPFYMEEFRVFDVRSNSVLKVLRPVQ